MVLVKVLYARLLDTRDGNEEKFHQPCNYSHAPQKYLNNNYFISYYNLNVLRCTIDPLILSDICATERSLSNFFDKF